MVFNLKPGWLGQTPSSHESKACSDGWPKAAITALSPSNASTINNRFKNLYAAFRVNVKARIRSGLARPVRARRSRHHRANSVDNVHVLPHPALAITIDLLGGVVFIGPPFRNSSIGICPECESVSPQNIEIDHERNPPGFSNSAPSSGRFGNSERLFRISSIVPLADSKSAVPPATSILSFQTDGASRDVANFNIHPLPEPSKPCAIHRQLQVDPVAPLLTW